MDRSGLVCGDVRRPRVGDVPLAEQFANHDGDRPAASSSLAGCRLRLFPSDRSAEVEAELGPESVSWGEVGSSRSRRVAPYEAIDLGGECFAVTVRIDASCSLFAFIDLSRRRAIAALTHLAASGDAGRVEEQTRYLEAGVGSRRFEPFQRSAALVGRRVLWRYSSSHAIEHIYLNPTSFCWHCLEGPERAMADVEPCLAYDLGDGERLLFSWSESVVPFNGALVVEPGTWSSVGRLFGWDTQRREAAQLVVGAKGALLNETAYPELRGSPSPATRSRGRGRSG